jgi:aryl-alcohol dehydrogenase-like predicted oxidoreductase
MQLRTLGRTNMQVSPLMLGGNVFGWTADEPTSFAILDAFVTAGGNFIDTADVYSAWVPGHTGGESETVIGKWFKRSGNRAQIILATKVGFPLGPDKKGLSAAYIERAVEDSLRRLQTDYIDIYFSHTDDAGVTMDETLSAYQRLIEKGKVRVLGVSNFSKERMSEAIAASKQHSLPAYQVVQPQYNLCERADYEANLEAFCQEHGLGVVTYYALASGFLTGKYRSESDLANRPRRYNAKKYLNDRGFRILAALDIVAKLHNATLAQVALAWIMARKSVVAPIASATSLAQVNELCGAMSLQINPSDIEQLNKASAT